MTGTILDFYFFLFSVSSRTGSSIALLLLMSRQVHANWMPKTTMSKITLYQSLYERDCWPRSDF